MYMIQGLIETDMFAAKESQSSLDENKKQGPVSKVNVSVVGAGIGLVLIHDLFKGRQLLVQLLISEKARHFP